MSRLIDRIRAYGCQPATVSLISGRNEIYDFLKNKLLDEAFKSGKGTSSDEIERKVAEALSNYCRIEPVSTEVFDVKKLDGVPVFAADDVALYTYTLPLGTDFGDVVSSMAPPFDKFFIEFQHIPNQWRDDKLNAWGTLISVNSDADNIQSFPEDKGKPRWILSLDTFLEREKGKPFGPVSQHVAGLAEDGTWFRHADGNLWWGGGLVNMTGGLAKKPPPPEAIKEYGDSVA